ncbi:MAG: aminodeoxychorismate synthase component I [Propionivibrio sp.]|jgi:para-aminobenzoate synthetase/4-amino-4-deoxychorismate lyase|uniref:aminodeoxychorismate synthase component I n=1 Tax=Propionivibrio sp. TaxID=2212460 RepID=UPI001B43A6A5|nr:aminodeoxychorismate synthase component I [Propionivibrio sp.]MBP7202068.1 aminodeoxychorismate synthase component I [Propionivibrio sp.]
MMADARHFALLDADDGAAWLLTNFRCAIGASDPDAVFAAVDVATNGGEWAILAADYELGACFDRAMVQPGASSPRLRGWVFGCAERLDADALECFFADRLAEMPAHDRICGVADAVLTLDAASHAAKVDQIRRWISEGDCYQVNLTFPVDFTAYGHPLALYARLRARQPVRYGAFVLTPEATILSFSPELFFERHGCRVVTRPMKGTAQRGATPEADARNRAALLASSKERAENVMIVDLLRNDLGRLAAPGGVNVEALCAIEAYPTLWQMVSTISADLPDAPLRDIFRALFPCGSITGAPKIRAMARIAEMESGPRGLYTGALGWVAPGGDCRFNVAIRTLEIHAAGHARLGIGSGIVIDADPAREYAECLLKASFVTGFDPGFELIETLRLVEGVYPLMVLHLQRIESSALALGFACDLSAISERLATVARECRDGAHRVRLTLAHDGRLSGQHAKMPADEQQWQIVVADEALDGDDYLLRHKTTARSRYDAALARLAAMPAVFDAIFCNTRGEVCEGARSNVYVERDGVLLTPPVSSGLLPGVMRRHLLESGRAVERVLYREDLLTAPAIYLSNALRGLFPVTLRSPSASPLR